MKLFFALAILCCSTAFAAPSAGRGGFGMYLAAGPLLSLGSLRIGGSEWEGGLLSPEIIGFDKVLRFGSYYTAFGFGMLIAPNVTYGFYGAAGYETNLFWGLLFRGEFSAASSPSGHSGATALAGVSVHL